MQHPEDIERWRRMTPAERLEIALHLRRIGWQFLRRLPAAEAQRRLDIALDKQWNLPRRSQRRT
jgi:hypothetical protein